MEVAREVTEEGERVEENLRRENVEGVVVEGRRLVGAAKEGMVI